MVWVKTRDERFFTAVSDGLCKDSGWYFLWQWVMVCAKTRDDIFYGSEWWFEQRLGMRVFFMAVSDGLSKDSGWEFFLWQWVTVWAKTRDESFFYGSDWWFEQGLGIIFCYASEWWVYFSWPGHSASLFRAGQYSYLIIQALPRSTGLTCHVHTQATTMLPCLTVSVSSRQASPISTLYTYCNFL